MRGWVLAGIRRAPGPLIGTVVSAATAAALSVAALSVAVAHTEVPAGRMAGAGVVVAADTHLHVTIGHGDDAHQSLPLAAYRGVPAALAGQLARVPGVARADGESGFPGGVVRPGDVDLVAVTARPGVPADALAGRIRAALHGGRGYTIATGAARGDVANLDAAVERSDGQLLGVALIPPIVMIALFVLVATTGLAVNLRGAGTRCCARSAPPAARSAGASGPSWPGAACWAGCPAPRWARYAIPGHGQRGVHPLAGLGRHADPGLGGGRAHRSGGRIRPAPGQRAQASGPGRTGGRSSRVARSQPRRGQRGGRAERRPGRLRQRPDPRRGGRAGRGGPGEHPDHVHPGAAAGPAAARPGRPPRWSRP